MEGRYPKEGLCEGDAHPFGKVTVMGEGKRQVDWSGKPSMRGLEEQCAGWSSVACH